MLVAPSGVFPPRGMARQRTHLALPPYYAPGLEIGGLSVFGNLDAFDALDHGLALLQDPSTCCSSHCLLWSCRDPLRRGVGGICLPGAALLYSRTRIVYTVVLYHYLACLTLGRRPARLILAYHPLKTVSRTFCTEKMLRRAVL